MTLQIIVPLPEDVNVAGTSFPIRWMDVVAFKKFSLAIAGDAQCHGDHSTYLALSANVLFLSTGLQIFWTNDVKGPRFAKRSHERQYSDPKPTDHEKVRYSLRLFPVHDNIHECAIQ